MRKLRVKIVRARYELYWYSDMVGEILEVIDHGTYDWREDYDYLGSAIYRDDCVELDPIEPVKKLKKNEMV